MAITRNGGVITVQQHIAEQERRHPTATGEFSWLLSAITLSTKIIGSYVRRAGLRDIGGYTEDENVQGEIQHQLDIVANDTLKRTLGYRRNVGIIASEEDDEPRVIQDIGEGGDYIIMFDPLDGSSNIESNVPVGTIFTVFGTPTTVTRAEDGVLQTGSRQLASGYVLYGSSTQMVYTTGDGVHMFTLDSQFGAYLLTRENIKMPEFAPQYSVNEAYRSTFPKGYQDYLFWAKGEKDSPQKIAPPETGFSLRYIGSLVADFHRILLKGGVFLYPPTKVNPEGKLRLMYEANPLAFIAEQAGGLATDGAGRIMDRVPENVHSRTPLVIGSKTNVEQVMAFVD